MNRLTRYYPGDCIVRVVAHGEYVLTLLVDDSHVKHDKINLACLNAYKLETSSKTELTGRMISRIVFPYYDDLYAEDIDRIEDNGGFYTIYIRKGVLVHFGHFNIYKRDK
ncbi:hypothetical protein PQC07_gp166 [Aeromonas phage D3]|uniref:Uncharacterized protein n=2 Tax=Ludhianavirus TaxID=3044751 RepID=A0A514A1T8_9CAUD|nr:hypothetical protein PQC06_gp040 [Aeromonas phage LAh10]YP_010668590.1 hypothetical protein PQC07_gp166 [Aeromonas phage D3]QDH47229.1 hypothetical protein LAh10_40 [Aeromonas phage LAh10]QDJ97107.1 hypothetical protein D3_0109 [Aeromonas phage D3]QEP52413.1 hypothetical protein D9_0206 [Aeromonas phage D9]